MRLGQVFTIRDQMAKQALFKKFDPSDEGVRQIINSAFEEAERAWRINLVEMFGERKASLILENMDKTLTDPSLAHEPSSGQNS